MIRRVVNRSARRWAGRLALPARAVALALCAGCALLRGGSTRSDGPVGAVAPTLSVDTIAPPGVLRPEALRGKVLVVGFWAAWCGEPCRGALGLMQRLFAQYGSQGLMAIGISVDVAADEAIAFAAAVGVAFPVVLDEDRAIAARWRPREVPTLFIVDRRGVIRSEHAGITEEETANLEREIRTMVRSGH